MIVEWPSGLIKVLFWGTNQGRPKLYSQDSVLHIVSGLQACLEFDPSFLKEGAKPFW